MNNHKFILKVVVFALSISGLVAFAQLSKSPKSTNPKLPMNIPPPPSFASFASKSGKFQLVSAEYYSEDPKPYLYKRLVKFDTVTGEAWILNSQKGQGGEVRTWIPLINR